MEQHSITLGPKACFEATLHHFLSKSLFWSNTPSLLEQKIVLEQRSITFGAKACFGATLHHCWSKSLFWRNPPSLLEQNIVLEQHSITLGAKACFGATLLEQKLVLEQHFITFGAKACFGATRHHFWRKTCFGATLHNFWSKILLWSNTPSFLVQKVVLEQRSFTFGPKACFGATLHRFSNKNKDEVIRGPVRSGPVRPVRASWAQGTGADRTDRTGPDMAKLDLASAQCRPCPVRSVRSAPAP